MARRQVLFDGTPLINKHLSGVGTVLLETLRAMDTDYYAQKYSIVVFLPFNEVETFKKRYAFSHVQLKLLPFSHKFLSLFSRMRIAPPLDLFLGGGIYIFENYRNWPLMFKKSKSITYVHDVAFKLFPRYTEENNLRYLNKYTQLWVKRADKIVTGSESSKIEIEHTLGIKNVYVVKDAVDEKLFYPRSQKEIKKVKQEWSLSDKYFLFLGNVEPRKNLETLVKAFTQYESQSGNHDTLFLVGGDGWRNEPIYREIKKAHEKGVDIIKNDKFVPDADLPSLMSGAMAVVMPSWHEGFGLPVVQALACGTPVIASDITSLREITAENGNHVVFFNPQNERDLAMSFDRVRVKKHVGKPQNILTWSESVKSLEALIDAS
jgi:glycosyltransferase involved in cell wall biosynthesis